MEKEKKFFPLVAVVLVLDQEEKRFGLLKLFDY